MTTTSINPAENNPWYVLATIYGEQTKTLLDMTLHARNRRIWNGWACGHMDEAGRAALAAQSGWPVSDFAPLTDTEQADIKKAFRDRLGSYHAIPASTDKIDLSEIQFSHTVLWERCIFSQYADFKNATFSEYADFGNTMFSEYTTFENTTFYDMAYFQNTTFSEYANFENATFTKSANFQNATFPASANFQNAAFTASAYFQNATFTESAYFQNATFTASASFQKATFTAYAYFQNATFTEPANFENATFTEPANFENSTFTESANFKHSTYTESANFKNATFTEVADFRGSIFNESVDFQNATFTGKTNFARAQFKKVVPRFHDATLRQYTRFTTKEKYWPTAYPDDKAADKAKDAYTRLRQFMSSLQKPDEEHFFHRRELECQACLEKGLTRLMLKAYGWFSDYGYSITRPSAWLFGIVLAFAPTYALHIKLTEKTEFLSALFKGLGVSFSSTFSFLGFMRTMHSDFFDLSNSYIELLSGTQTILGVVFLFLFGLGLRTRFRMR